MPYWNRWMGDNRFSCQWRVIPSALHCNWVRDLPRDRFDKLNVLLSDPRQDGKHILVCPSSPTMERFYKQENWLHETLAELKKHTDRPIIVRKKPRARGTSGPMVASIPFAEAAKGAWAVVTLASIAGVEAACLGVPVFCHEASACSTIGNTRLSDIENPRFERNQDWLNTLAYHQYTEEELKKGMANDIVLHQ